DHLQVARFASRGGRGDDVRIERIGGVGFFVLRELRFGETIRGRLQWVAFLDAIRRFGLERMEVHLESLRAADLEVDQGLRPLWDRDQAVKNRNAGHSGGADATPNAAPSPPPQ